MLPPDRVHLPPAACKKYNITYCLCRTGAVFEPRLGWSSGLAGAVFGPCWAGFAGHGAVSLAGLAAAAGLAVNITLVAPDVKRTIEE
jgi:hypothetical protein